MKINQEDWTATIDLTDNATYVVKDGHIKKVTPVSSGFGKQTITWQQEKPVYEEVTITEKL
ncbi:DUF3954 domain-containing protein [Paenalkalicoccus suaedae]|uniref:DUF3954 domain-containing protein n=1 Tax=Paenalkalicoccus suaedae TaxID=2592382 RepID=A0A859FBX8_9BACI|nr:DUF3954 domain-containing protein [Paenalkalicoccus suaedae]QKS70241.1 DUF3954 domain-containing protein [Paenalkalicoccus suaedae]